MFEGMWSRARAAIVTTCLIALGAAGCSSSAGEACATDDDCQPGYECVSTGGVVFGESICLLAEQPTADAQSEQPDTGASDTADLDAEAPSDVATDASEEPDTLQDLEDASDASDTTDLEDAADADAADTDTTDVVEDTSDVGCTPTNGGQEACDGEDNDCDGQVDEGVKTTYYRDMDSDDYGVTGDTVESCSPSRDYSALQGGDCNDRNEDINPGAIETCDGRDNNCDGQIDEGVLTTYYLDTDDDGYGVTGDSQESCSPSGDYTATQDGDCEDGNADAYPGATEQCSPFIDYDCDGDTMCADSACAGEPCLTSNGSGYCSSGSCVVSSGCFDDTDCGFREDCQFCSDGPNVCCPEGQLCLCRQR
ncbi:putative metal-binding motif-containing protein [Persicimonas caeni]|nr:putative metal-binding motif-containing protein [Persicimonas caeni]